MSGSRRFLTERRTILLTYGIAFTIGVIILAYGLWVANWNFYDWLEQPLVQTTLYFSAAVIRAVAGFGLIATYIAIFEILLAIFSRAYKARGISRIVKGAKLQDLFSRGTITDAVKNIKITETFKGEKISEAVKGEKISAVLAGKKGRKIRIAGVVFFLVLVPLFILAYVTIRFINTVSGGGGQTLFDIAYLMVGVWGLLLTVYLLPIARGDFITFEKMSDLSDKLKEGEVRRGLNSLKDRIEGFYNSKIKREQEQPEEQKAVDKVAEAVALEHAGEYADTLNKIGFESVRETVLAYRHMVTDYLLLPVVLGSLVVPPVALLFLVVFGRAFFFKKEVGRSLLERIIVVGAVMMAGAWASVDIIFGQITVLVSFDYLIGAFIGVIVFLYLARRAI
ncbi:MAG: hypothetical protein WED04_06505 [Promethearchaeati archaeon SRVP18_Atabeyarchaeia-1]